jgi:hypothetical protein
MCQWNISPLSSGLKSKPGKKPVAELRLLPAFVGTLLFDPEDGGDIFVRNVWLSPNYTALPPKIS